VPWPDLDGAVEVSKCLHGSLEVLAFGNFDREGLFLSEKVEGDLGETGVDAFWQCALTESVRREETLGKNLPTPARRK
jgi:hypothetical protein